MARGRRVSIGGIAYHVMNRTWGGIELFADSGDYVPLEGEGAMKQVLAVWPVERLGDWVERVNRPQDEKELTGEAAQWGSRSAVWGCTVDDQDGWPVGP